jgi:mycothiol synthase
MSEIIYRPYQSGDEAAIIELWNRCLPKDPITPRRFRHLVLLDANFDPQGLRLAYDGDQLVGCMYAVRRLLPMLGADLEPDNGWIPWFFVAASHRRKGIGSQLLGEVAQFLRINNRKQVFFSSYAPNYILPGMDETTYPEGYQFLLHHDFVIQYSPVAMDYTLVNYEIPEDVRELRQRRVSEGYIFRQAQDCDLYETIQFATRVFNPDWGRAIREGILQGMALSQIYIVRDPQGQLVGFCLYGGYEGIRERFGPFGVDPGQQGTGLGKILLYDCLEAMRALGLHGAWFLWTSTSSPAGHLYKRVGFRVTRQFHVMKKTLVNGG